MLKWFWVRALAMHWASKLFCLVFLVQAGVYLAQAYQLKYLRIPAFDELRRTEGKLILVKQGEGWLTGVEHPDGSKELFNCQWPGLGMNKLCFMKPVIDKFKLDTKPEVILWWYPMTVPLEDRIYPYIFQVQLKNENRPLGSGSRIDYSYAEKAKPTGLPSLKTKGVRGKLGMALLYILGFIFLFLWESYKYSARDGSIAEAN